jgi:26S proteasome regulatory subunit N8
MGALEAEEVGVEHLLRDIRRLSGATLAAGVEARLMALRSLDARLGTLLRYVDDVRAGKLPLSQRIVGQLQDAFNLAPAVSRPPLANAFATASNVHSFCPRFAVCRSLSIVFFLCCCASL